MEQTIIDLLQRMGVYVVISPEVQEGMGGYYHPFLGMIKLASSLLETRKREVLVHETVHVLQHARPNGQIGFPLGLCSLLARGGSAHVRAHYPRERWRAEVEAYALQYAWLDFPKEVENYLIKELELLSAKQ